MAKSKIIISVDAAVLSCIDIQVRSGRYANRSQAFEAAAKTDWEQDKDARLVRACSLADPAKEIALAELGLVADTADWPVY